MISKCIQQPLTENENAGGMKDNSLDVELDNSKEILESIVPRSIKSTNMSVGQIEEDQYNSEIAKRK